MQRVPPAKGSVAWGCRSPLGFLVVAAVSALLCCTLGVVGGAVLGELGMASWLWPRAETQQQQPRRSVPVSLIDRLPTHTPTPVQAVTPPPTIGPPESPPPRAPAAANPTATAPNRVSAPSPEATSAPVMHAAAPAIALPANQPARPATRLAIPALGVDVPVVLIGLENGTWPVDRLAHTVGHLQGTASPGDPSNVAIAGHVTLAEGGDGPFRNLAQLRQGDEVVVFVESQAYRYAVTEVRIVSPDDVAVTAPTAAPQLTLITCANWNRERHAYDQRIVAIARLVS